MDLKYKFKQFWLRRFMWIWCFQCWQNLMFPQVYFNDECDFSEFHNNHWFWCYLNNFDGDSIQ